EEISNPLRSLLVRHQRGTHASPQLEYLAQEMGRRAKPARRQLEPVWLALEHCHKLGYRPCRHGWIYNESTVRHRHLDDRHEVGVKPRIHPWEQGWRRHGADAHREYGVSIRRLFQYIGHPNCREPAGFVLDDDAPSLALR